MIHMVFEQNITLITLEFAPRETDRMLLRIRILVKGKKVCALKGEIWPQFSSWHLWMHSLPSSQKKAVLLVAAAAGDATAYGYYGYRQAQRPLSTVAFFGCYGPPGQTNRPQSLKVTLNHSTGIIDLHRGYAGDFMDLFYNVGLACRGTLYPPDNQVVPCEDYGIVLGLGKSDPPQVQVPRNPSGDRNVFINHTLHHRQLSREVSADTTGQPWSWVKTESPIEK
eukprot:g9299.t1